MAWHRSKVPPELEPDAFSMTPLIDVTFQLLMFFMLASEMASGQVEALTLPSASRAVMTKEPSLVLNITADGRVRVGGRTFSDEALEALFEARSLRRGERDIPLLVRADRSSSFEHLQKVLTIAAQRGQVARVDLGAIQERSRP
jgi:biopolymer transport protein ExbD